MSLKLILMRHAKSGWDDPTLSDHQRGLTARGEGAAAAIGQWLAAGGHVPDVVLSSDAARTRATWDHLQLAASQGAVPQFTRDLYLASAAMILHRIQRVEDASTVMVIGHNPGIGELAVALLAQPAEDSEIYRYPTCATSVITFEAEDWSSIGPAKGMLAGFTVPRRLA